MHKIVLKSFAKINLALNVLRKRKDGYHQIESIVQAIDLYDILTLKKIPSGIRINTSSKSVPRDKKNSVFQAARVFLERNGIKSGVEIGIKKNIPVGAGLGGGSSNAAFTLKGLSRLFDKKIPLKKLILWGSEIGSDVPFFFSSGQALISGRGEKVKEIKVPGNYFIVLVKPDFSIPTAWAYKNLKLDLTKKSKAYNLKANFSNSFFTKHINIRSWKNDLERVCFSKYPILFQLKQYLIQKGAVHTLMSGSGPTIFGIFLNQTQAKEVAGGIRGKGFFVRVTKPVAL